MRRSGVVGVFWGVDVPGGRGKRLRVHVERKYALHELHPTRVIDKHVDNLRTCVVEVGEPTGHVITCKELVRPRGEADRVSTMTALVNGDDAWFALVSGHGTLPVPGGAFDTSYDDGDDPPAPVELRDVSSGADLTGTLVLGRLTSTQDWAVARVAMPTDDVDLAYPVTSTYRPRVRRTALGKNEPVRQYSSLDRITKRGTVSGYGEVRLTLHDGNKYLFTRVFEIHGSTRPFAREGDSGSLVADEANRAVGVVIGGAGPPNDQDRVAYVLPFAAPDGSVLAGLQRFFS